MRKIYMSDMNDLLNKYLGDYVPDNVNKEFEIRFSTLNMKRSITKIDFDNVCSRLKSLKFNCANPNGNYYLRVQNTYMNAQGKEILSNIRFELNGLHIIRDFCLYENINRLMENESFDGEMEIVKKDRVKMPNGEPLKHINNDDYQFRAAYQHESKIKKNSNIVNKIVHNWDNSKKLYRYINRIELKHDDYPILFHLSIVKSNKREKNGKGPKLAYSLQESNLFNNAESYEIELEIDNARLNEERWKDSKVILESLKKCIKQVLCGMQKTNYPITLNEKKSVFAEYLEIVYGEDHSERLDVKHFIGPSNLTLQRKNILDNGDDNIANIRVNYSVTDKADGERYLLYISSEGKIYLIDINMNLVFTGSITKNKDYFNSLLDGEYITHDKYGLNISLFACFDIYFLKKEDVRKHIFINNEIDLDGKKEKITRLSLLKDVVENLKPKSITKNKKILTHFIIEVKHFEVSNDIFKSTKNIHTRINDPTFIYNTDGFIYTPIDRPLPEKKYKFTWDRVFKWKPPEFNTIDFLVSVNKDEQGGDKISYYYSDGNDVSNENIPQYKTLTLMVGFNQRDHGYMNPCADIINDNIVRNKLDYSENYKATPFYPTNPYDDKAHICNIQLKIDENNVLQMFTEEGEVIEDNMIVEFKYDVDDNYMWRWKPLRVRYDKTAQFRNGLPNYGNAYHVANSNWYSIHNPISKEMITTGENIPEDMSLDDVYYNRIKNKSNTRGLRDFHNLFVKRLLITRIAKRNDILIDLAVGKAGDFPKWIASKLKFVFGIDVSKDNIENKLDGACARYLNYAKETRNIPKVLFAHGDSSSSIANGDAFKNDLYKNIGNAVLGKGPKDEKLLGSGVFKHYGIGENGFQICSCQFAIHYFFENINKLEQFLKNVSLTTAVGGYFIGTSYDGKSLFNKLVDTEKDDSITIYNDENEEKVWQLIKKYDYEKFEDNSSCLNYAIDVYQDSINQVFREYLVNYDYLDRIMENFGFVHISQKECEELNIPGDDFMFKSLYNYMHDEVKLKKIKEKDIGTSLNMKDYEKEISFLNRCFIYKKIRSVPLEDQVIHDDEIIDEKTIKKSVNSNDIVKTSEKIELYNYKVDI
tara:strand:- start:1849 stop:5142 length:3294 start_codon:yes stop_codon:yes gene_type:complete